VGGGHENPQGDMMTTAAFQKGDRVEFKEFPEIAASACWSPSR
jgi:hypothetical protein